MADSSRWTAGDEHEDGACERQGGSHGPASETGEEEMTASGSFHSIIAKRSRRTLVRSSIGLLAFALAWSVPPGRSDAQSQSLRTQLVEQSTLTRATKAKVLRVAWAQWPPLMYTDPKTNKLAGFTVDLYEEYLGPALGAKIEWVESSWSTIVAGLQADKYDVVANANRTFKRLLVADYAGPLTSTGKALLTTKDKVGKFHDWHDADSAGTKICVPLGTSADTAVTQFFTKAEITRVEGDPACIAAVAAGRSDIYSTDLGNLISLTTAHPEFAVIPKSTFTKVELGIFVKQGDQLMVNWLNQFMREAKLNGSVDRLIKKYDLKGVEVAW
jgi:polar amino acid transport system substrate-binding protein